MKVGEYFRCNQKLDSVTYESIMLLAQVEAFKVCLIDLKTGNRYNDPVEVESISDISESEQKRIFYCVGDLETYFTPIDPPKFF